MYLERIELKNVGPISELNLALQFTEEGNPKPLVIVGRNGSGKSLLLAHVVNALIAARNPLYDDVEVEKGKVFKIRTPIYIQTGKPYFTAKLSFSNNFFQSEVQLNRRKPDFEAIHGPLAGIDWPSIPNDAISHYWDNFFERKEELRKTLGASCQLYFPLNRFEDPAWLNQENLINRASYLSLKSLAEVSNRTLINYSPLKTNQEWLLDLLYDCNVLEKKFTQLPIGGLTLEGVGYLETSGPSTDLMSAIAQFICRLMYCQPPIKWIVGSRGRRAIGIMKDEMPLTTNLFALSTGQVVLLNIFLSILRDCDIAASPLKSISDVRGIVIIDEIDLHLHSDMQHELIPLLLSQFPKVQFIITTHSPLFVMGMKRHFGENQFTIVDLPSGEEIAVEQFSEFEKAYNAFRSSTKYASDLKLEILRSKKPILFVEGVTDIGYLQLAAERLGEIELLSKFEIHDANGHGGLDKIWSSFDTWLADPIKRHIVLLYDCDVRKQTSRKNEFIFRYIMPQTDFRIGKGIENLLSDALIQRTHAHKPAFFDVVDAHTVKKRGVPKTISETWNVNEDEKTNLLNWCKASASRDDLLEFQKFFDALRNETITQIEQQT
jgi:hypothetical protein